MGARSWSPPQRITLFHGEPVDRWLDQRFAEAAAAIKARQDDEVLDRTVDDLLDEVAEATMVEPLDLRPEPIDLRVDEGERTLSDGWGGELSRPLTVVVTEFEYTGHPELWKLRPSTYPMESLKPVLRTDQLRLVFEREYDSTPKPESVRAWQERTVEHVLRFMTETNKTVNAWNDRLDTRLRQVIEERRQLLLSRRGLAAELGFPIERRTDAPVRVPVQPKRVLTQQPRSRSTSPYQPEYEITDTDYENVLQVILGTLRAIERTPSVASRQNEEQLRDQILVQLNGSFNGTATGETFVRSGKTDLLVVADDRHVFVGECKWWTGQKACRAAVDQLLGYLPWRNEKAALILFIDRKGATEIIDKADAAVRGHPAWKREGRGSAEPTAVRHHVLGHPDDPVKEIKLALMFAVLPPEAS